MRRPALACILLASALSGCATQSPPQDVAIKVYQYNEVRNLKYRIVERIWGESWQSAFYIPGYPSVEQAANALKARAMSAGADAVLNLACIDQQTFFERKPAYICYGDAIKIE